VWGATVYAPGDGAVVFVENDIQDNAMGQTFEFEARPDIMQRADGNCVAIDHGNGEVSWMVHLQKGSVLVKKGDVVKQGQELAKVGLSGDAGHYVHLHYTFTDRFSFNHAEGVPLSFRNFYKKYGNEAKLIDKGSTETGEIVWSNARYL
jgi:murein DD-endopeptidase MepM/ murein hydrolase activator NlpD